MKTLFFLAVLFISSTTSAQVENEIKFKSARELLKSKTIPGKIEFQFPSASTSVVPTVSPETRVQTLALDNMPCLVPNMRLFNMPVKRNPMPSINMPVLVPVIPHN